MTQILFRMSMIEGDTSEIPVAATAKVSLADGTEFSYDLSGLVGGVVPEPSNLEHYLDSDTVFEVASVTVDGTVYEGVYQWEMHPKGQVAAAHYAIGSTLYAFDGDL